MAQQRMTTEPCESFGGQADAHLRELNKLIISVFTLTTWAIRRRSTRLQWRKKEFDISDSQQQSVPAPETSFSTLVTAIQLPVMSQEYFASLMQQLAETPELFFLEISRMIKSQLCIS
ncbi:hypothetical protein K3495_g3907 [Podosphaera aphanis]|nr:hypothetical protein K3495_g3907 [Podosphaera aphanis]